MTSALTGDLSIVEKIRRATRWMNGAAMIIPAIVLASFWLDLPSVERLSPALTPMSSTSAIALLAVGAGTWLVRSGGPRRRRLAKVLGGLVSVFGLARAAECTWGFDLGTHGLLLRGSANTALLSAVGLHFLGTSIAAIDVRVRDRQASELLARGSQIIGALCVLGYLFAAPFHEANAFRAMALHTGLCLLLLSLVVVFDTMDGDLFNLVTGDTAGGRFARALLPAALTVPVALGLVLATCVAAGLVDSPFALALMAFGNMASFSLLTLKNARALSGEDEKRKRAEDAMKESQARFDALYKSGIVGILVTKNEGAIVAANDAFLQMLGYQRHDVDSGSLRWSSLTPADHASRSASALESLKARGFAPPFEKEYLHKDGSRVPVLIGVAALDATTNVTIVSDLSERKRAQAALVRSEEQLRQSQKMDAIGRLAGGVAHDFNNLLSIILSYSEIGQVDLSPDDPMRADLAEIQNAANRAGNLTRQLLLFSRQQVPEPSVLDLSVEIVSLDKMLRRILGEDIKLASVAGEAVGRIRADKGHIEQVILNLVVNARDAMPTGGKLTIETANADLDEEYVRERLEMKSGRYVMLAVTDTGCGMDKATQARIFEPFFTTKEKGKGTGLGLSTVFGIVKQAGGDVFVYSEPDQGTTFKVYFPRIDDDALSDAMIAPVVASFIGTETILVVEDDPQVRAVACNILRRNGYDVLDAKDAAHALLHCASHAGRIHLLLTDVVMPEVSGPDLTKRVVGLRPDIAVVFMSGYTDDTVFRHGVLNDEVWFVQKPFTPKSLVGKVREALDALPREAKTH